MILYVHDIPIKESNNIKRNFRHRKGFEKCSFHFKIKIQALYT